jgi:riboflavin transporter FmnP
MRNQLLERQVKIALLGAIAFLLMLFEVRLPFFADFLKYDAGDVPAAIATFTLGPVAGLLVEVIKSLLYLFLGAKNSGLVGTLANLMAGAAFVLGISLSQYLLGKLGRRHWAWDLVSAVSGTLLMTAVLIPINALLIYPAFGWTGAAAWTGALTVSTPFNLFKGFLSATLSLVLYRRLAGLLVGKPAGSAA